MIILPLHYAPNIQWFTKFLFGESVIDIYEYYRKQSYRNRCDVLTANGPVSLIVNTVKTPNFNKKPVKDIRIDYSKRWQHQQWNTLVSSYKSSPFFDYYQDLLFPFFHSRYEFLYDLNYGILETILRILGSEVKPVFSEFYTDPASGEDWRDGITGKPRLRKTDPAFIPAWYQQVFEDRFGFIPSFSVLDLIFCEGPAAMQIIRNSFIDEKITDDRV